jgi:hypothetical protein
MGDDLREAKRIKGNLLRQPPKLHTEMKFGNHATGFQSQSANGRSVSLETADLWRGRSVRPRYHL